MELEQIPGMSHDTYDADAESQGYYYYYYYFTRGNARFVLFADELVLELTVGVVGDNFVHMFDGSGKGGGRYKLKWNWNRKTTQR